MGPELIDALQRAIQLADAQVPWRRPWREDERAVIVATAQRCLGYHDAWVPRILVERRHRARSRQRPHRGPWCLLVA